MADLLFTCCVPMTSPAAAVSQVLPVRREDIDHRNNEILGASRTGIYLRIFWSCHDTHINMDLLVKL
jgi:hypothetical protein